jgi:hypothetical protein
MAGRGGTEHYERIGRTCGAKNRAGNPCRQPARRGQSRCRLHGGNTPGALLKAERTLAQAELVEEAHKYGKPVATSHVDALEAELQRSAGHVEYLAEKVQMSGTADPNLLAVYHAERQHHLKLLNQTKELDDRKVYLTEKNIDRLYDALAIIVAKLGHDVADDYVRDIVADALRAVGVTMDRDDVIDAEPDRPEWEERYETWADANGMADRPLTAIEWNGRPTT